MSNANTGLLPIGSDGRCLALMEQCLPSELQVVAIPYIEFRQRFQSPTRIGIADARTHAKLAPVR